MTNKNRRQRVAILGSTGSIGVSTLEVIARHPQRFAAVAELIEAQGFGA